MSQPRPPSDPPTDWLDPAPGSTLRYWQWVPAQNWQLGADGRRCRYTVGPGHKSCGEPAVAILDRGGQDGRTRWAYCARHLYGRELRDGVIWEYRPAPGGATGGGAS